MHRRNVERQQPLLLLTVWMEHWRHKLDHRRLVWVVLRKLHCQLERACMSREGLCSYDLPWLGPISIPRAATWQAWGLTNSSTSVPRRVLGPEDDSVPVHDVVRVGGPIDALGRVIAQALEIPHEPLQMHQQTLRPLAV